MLTNDKLAKLRKMADEPEPETFRFEKPGDEIAGTVIALHRIDFKGSLKWELVIDTDEGPRKMLLTIDLTRKLTEDRDVQPGDAVLLRFHEVDIKSGFRTFRVAVDPDRPRTIAVPVPLRRADSWPTDADAPSGDEPPF
jgi:hypothetical protein